MMAEILYITIIFFEKRERGSELQEFEEDDTTHIYKTSKIIP